VGISTLYLAAAVADNGMGSVVSTELNSAKVAAAHGNLIEAHLSDHVTILPGDAMTALNDIRVFPRRAMPTVVFADLSPGAFAEIGSPPLPRGAPSAVRNLPSPQTAPFRE
jgi:predicted O-methyltransferase YrrM